MLTATMTQRTGPNSFDLLFSASNCGASANIGSVCLQERLAHTHDSWSWHKCFEALSCTFFPIAEELFEVKPHSAVIALHYSMFAYR